LRKARFILLPVLMFLLISVAGCSSGPEAAARVSEFYSGLSAMELQAALTAEFSDYAVDFELQFSYDSQGESYVKVKKPVEIEGVRIKFDDNGTTLEYEGASLEVGAPEETVISPAAVLPELLRVWSEGIVSEQGTEKIDGTDCFRLTYRSKKNDTEILFRTWFDQSSLKPLKADIFTDGKKKISCEFLLAENFK